MASLPSMPGLGGPRVNPPGLPGVKGTGVPTARVGLMMPHLGAGVGMRPMRALDVARTLRMPRLGLYRSALSKNLG